MPGQTDGKAGFTCYGDKVDLVQGARRASHAVAHTQCQSVDAVCNTVQGIMFTTVCLDCFGTLC